MKKAIVVAYHNMGCAGLRSLILNGIDVVAVFTYSDDPGEANWFESVAELAAKHSIPCFAPDDINHPLWITKIREMKPDFLFSFYYRDLLCSDLLEIPVDGCFNLHGSLLPKYRGRAPINWAIANGETQTGVTLHHMTIKADDGDIVGQHSVRIEPDDTAFTLNGKLVLAAEALLEVQLPLLVSGNATRVTQKHEEASYFGGRKPADGHIDWKMAAGEICDLVRAVTQPYPGAFTYKGQKKVFIWSSSCSNRSGSTNAAPGTIINIDPLEIASGNGAVKVDYAQLEGGIYQSGRSIARDLNLAVGSKFAAKVELGLKSERKKRVLILGINGFIGNALTERLLTSGKFEVHGLDRNSDAVSRFLDHPNFFFHEGDISIHREWIEYHVKKCDVVLPLVAIATPIEYTRNPLKVFELDFEENLRIVRYCVKYKKRMSFPYTSEVYGMCSENEFDEDSSNLVLGPIHKQRWIYSCSKQLLDRVIWAYGQSEDLKFSLFRPFNWLGPRLDSLDSARIGSSRAITQLILNLVEGSPIQLIDGGEQKRCFTDVDEGIECLYKIVLDEHGNCNGEIVNIGNPTNEASIRELATMLTEEFEKHPLRHRFPPLAGMHEIESRRYYGDGYEDVQHRRPSIANAQRLFDWTPKTPLRDSIRKTLDFFLEDYVAQEGVDRKQKISIVA